ncbi:MAG: phosphatidylserine decarboxylase family protein [Deltaproteobacteria bacterium]|nr:phosphatidylserine decarboxylase family protein [Deltaproteobacteria bacterium]
MKTRSKVERTKIHNRLPVAREGFPFILIGILITLSCLLFHLLVPGILAAVLALFTIYFFRDPDRRAEVEEKVILAPADGRVVEIRTLEDGENPFGEPALKVGIFMSIFDVHVNRIPTTGRISKIQYRPGRFLSANLDKASEENENNRITLETPDGGRLLVVQIAGLIARRIACWVRENDLVKAGMRFGLIRFGSRLDVYLPRESRVLVQRNQKVKAGLTKLGYLP